MTLVPVTAGFIPLVDCAPLVVAAEMGFAAEEGLDLALTAAPSWATLRDLVAFGKIDVAHLLAPVPVAIALGLGGLTERLDALSVLNVNGNVVGVSAAIEARLRASGYGFDFADPAAAGRALIDAAPDRLRVGVPFPFSMHAELVYYWLAAVGLSVPDALDVHTVPPPHMAEALGAGEIDAFCVGEPWGSVAVESGAGALLLPGAAIRAFAPEKVLAARHDWAARDPETAFAMIRAIWRAQRWLARPENLSTAAEVLARAAIPNVPAEIIERALNGRLVVTPRGQTRRVPRFLEFFAGAAGFPWRSDAVWIAERLAARNGLDRTAARDAARAVTRSDLYRQAMAPLACDLPGASERMIGAVHQPTPVASRRGTLILQPDAFFDGTIFDPHAAN